MAIALDLLKALPAGPGCYIYIDSTGTDIYVGKAKNLKKRVSSYFYGGRIHSVKTQRLVEEAVSLRVVETDSEVEALLLENRLIKDLQPRYNINLKDDKEYPILVITREPFPRVFISRDHNITKVDVFGPFTNATQLRRAYHFLMRVFQFRTCDLDIQPDDPRRRNYSPCLNYHIKRCSAPCTTKIQAPAYGDDIKALKAFISGRGKRQVTDALRERMTTAAQAMRYEDAARYRDQLNAIDRLSERGRLRDYDTGAAPVIAADDGQRQLMEALELAALPRIIEGFDIAHLMGDYVVAAMVQFVDGVPNKDGYRRYRVRGEFHENGPGNDDFASMREVVGRRYRRLRNEGRDLPQVILIDGGHGQVSMAQRALAEVGITDICLVGLAKREETIIRSDGSELKLSRRHSGLKLLQYIRDEAHRFSRRYLHSLQGKALTAKAVANEKASAKAEDQPPPI